MLTSTYMLLRLYGCLYISFGSYYAVGCFFLIVSRFLLINNLHLVRICVFLLLCRFISSCCHWDKASSRYLKRRNPTHQCMLLFYIDSLNTICQVVAFASFLFLFLKGGGFLLCLSCFCTKFVGDRFNLSWILELSRHK